MIVAESTDHFFSQIKDVLLLANEQITAHNLTVDNLTAERSRLIDDVWQYLLTHDLNDVVTQYEKDSRGLNAAIASIEKQIEEKKQQLASADVELRKLERGITSVQPTVDGINSLLEAFGFTGFKVAATEDGKRYRLLRENGADAKQTLSEGERTFVTFLYFFHRLQGGLEGTAVSGDRVVVFDDPVSSLDSNVLFVVSTLVRKIVEQAITGSKAIKQVFVLTHNVYFHKEVTFDAKRGEGRRPYETFWLVTKNYGQSSILSHDTNPVKTSYELLWRELKKPLVDNLSVQNTLRRILENYFKILGNIDIAVILDSFDGRQSIACRSLLSWVNDGSHFAWDDAFCQVDGVTTEMYLEVFRLIFEKLNHSAHYEMMMGLTSVALAEAPRPSVPVSAAN